MTEQEKENETSPADVVETQEVELASTGEAPASPPADTAPADAETTETETVEKPEQVEEKESEGETWQTIQEQIENLSRKVDSLSRKLSKVSSSKSPNPPQAEDAEEVGELTVESPPAREAVQKKPLLARRKRGAKRLPRPKKRAVGKS